MNITLFQKLKEKVGEVIQNNDHEQPPKGKEPVLIGLHISELHLIKGTHWHDLPYISA